jgi:hypothetical protein
VDISDEEEKHFEQEKENLMLLNVLLLRAS